MASTTPSSQSKVFLAKTHDAIKNGTYDKHLSFPFMTKEILYASFKNRVTLKEAKGISPILTDADINDVIKDAKETAAYTAVILFNAGILRKNESGELEVSKAGKVALKEVSFVTGLN
jgi:hypothetical protein